MDWSGDKEGERRGGCMAGMEKKGARREVEG